MNQFAFESNSADFTTEDRFGWYIRHNMFRDRTVEKDVLDTAKKIGKVIRGDFRQCFSSMKLRINNGVRDNHPEIMELCKKYAIDPALPMAQQDRAAIWAAIQAEIAKRSATPAA